MHYGSNTKIFQSLGNHRGSISRVLTVQFVIIGIDNYRIEDTVSICFR